MKRVFFIISLMYLVTPVCSQISQDSAQFLFDKIYLMESTDPSAAIQQYQDLIPQLERYLDKGRAYSYIGMVQLAQGQYDSMEFYLAIALDNFQFEEYDRGEASVYNALGNANLYRGYYTSALENYQKALPFYEQEGQEYNLTVILNNMASMFQHNNDQETSFIYLNRALTISKRLKDPKSLAASYNNISSAYVQLSDYKKSYTYADSAVYFISQTDDNRLKINLCSNLAQSAIYVGEIQRAYSILNEIDAFISKVNDVESTIVLDQCWALYFLKTKEYSKAIESGKKALANLQIFNDKRYEEQTLSILHDAAVAEGNYPLALNYYKQMDTVKSNSFLADRNNQVAELESIYQNEKKEQQITVQQLELNKEKSKRNLYLGMMLLTGIIGLYAWNLMKNRKEKAEQRLKLEQEKSKTLEQEQKVRALDFILQGQEDERKRIAQDLHDGLGGLLTSVRRKVSLLQEAIHSLASADIIQEAETLIETACDEVRRISHDMMPATLTSLGLEDAIEDLATELIPSDQTKFEFAYHINESSLSEVIKLNTYRIIQELMNNSVKHANANQIKLTINVIDHIVYLNYEDSGEGFSLEEATSKKGIGLKSIRSRIQYLNGTVEIISAANQGSTYKIEIPLKE